MDEGLLKILEEQYEIFDSDADKAIASVKSSVAGLNHTLQPSDWDYVRNLDRSIREDTYRDFKLKKHNV